MRSMSWARGEAGRVSDHRPRWGGEFGVGRAAKASTARADRESPTKSALPFVKGLRPPPGARQGHSSVPGWVGRWGVSTTDAAAKRRDRKSTSLNSHQECEPTM